MKYELTVRAEPVEASGLRPRALSLSKHPASDLDPHRSS